MFIKKIHKSSTDSTSTWTKELVPTLQQEELLVLSADTQTHGRGRHEKTWYSPKGKNIYITFSFLLNILKTPPCCFSQLGGVVVQRFLNTFGVTASIKWPNDLLVKNKKIAGILTEIEPLENNTAVLIGIGVNCNMTKNDLKAVDCPTTSILSETKSIWPLKHLRETLVNFFTEALIQAKQDDFEEVQKIWHAEVQWMCGKQILHETAQGVIERIEPNGTLVVMTSTGKKHIHSGDVACY